MQQSREKNSRVLRLLLCLSLIGGIGCAIGPVRRPTPEQQLAARQAADARRRQIIETLERKATAGDTLAVTQLGIDYAGGDRYLGVVQDVPRGMHLLEQAAAQRYAPAEYILGWSYLSGEIPVGAIQTPLKSIPHQPAQGIELLKQSASHACNTFPIEPFTNTANLISNLYRAGKFVDADFKQADLWRARSIVHCKVLSRLFVVNVILNPKSMTMQSKIEAMTLLLLMPPSDTASRLQSTLPPEDLQTAIHNAATLRQEVADSEQQYPAPPYPGKP